ncbi:PAS domain-containing protein [Castellaniella defragrans]|uniref:PAS domain S-box-containing protein n=2 Tax=Castellaniella defragrans TaxID=75697 RepID=A0A7W9WMT2_CASDE|nr:PAS domain-containing protein [Castellaniella defragrans]KAB0620553.1 PAS domain-containing protein [Castellaniella defragrans]MBB6083121.1 PAS domain S-box-containing protein [Castellaniella defragrans]
MLRDPATGRKPRLQSRSASAASGRPAAPAMDASVLVLEIDADLEIVAMNRTAAGLLGDGVPCRAIDVLDVRSAFDIREFMRNRAAGMRSAYRVLGLRFPGEARHARLIGLIENVGAGPEYRLRATIPLGVQASPELEELIRSEEINRELVQAASEAMWCIDFSEPVDLGRGMHEIVRQVFENECRWFMCNEAMARLYDLPEGMDLNEQPVSHYFPRNQENEAFVMEIIKSGCHVENALSIDTDHDGSIMYMENTVHCKILDGFLIRMWGTTRDVTGYRRTRTRLAREASDVRSILDAMPDAILVIDRGRRLLAVNAAFQKLFGWSPYDFFGQDIQSIVDLNTPLPNDRKWYGINHQRWVTTVRVPDGSRIACNAQSFPIGDDVPDRFVLMLCPAAV